MDARSTATRQHQPACLAAPEISRRGAHPVGNRKRRNAHRQHHNAHAGLDTGDIFLQQELRIAPDDTSETLAPRLATAGADLILETLRGLQAGTIEPRQQNDSQATMAPILKKEDGQIDFSRTAAEIYNRLRGFQPWPGAYTKFRGKNLQILKAKPANESVPQSELKVIVDHLVVGCGANTALELLELQLEGKKRTSALDFIHGYRPKENEKLGALM